MSCLLMWGSAGWWIVFLVLEIDTEIKQLFSSTDSYLLICTQMPPWSSEIALLRFFLVNILWSIPWYIYKWQLCFFHHFKIPPLPFCNKRRWGKCCKQLGSKWSRTSSATWNICHLQVCHTLKSDISTIATVLCNKLSITCFTPLVSLYPGFASPWN